MTRANHSSAASVGVWDHRLDRGRFRRFAAGDPGGDVAVEQHVEHLLAAGRTHDVLRLHVVLEVAAFVRDVGDAIEIDAVLGAENAAHPDAGRLRVGPNADLLAVEILRLVDRAAGLFQDRTVVKAVEHDRRPAAHRFDVDKIEGQSRRAQRAVFDRLRMSVGVQQRLEHEGVGVSHVDRPQGGIER